MKQILTLLTSLFILTSCATGPVHTSYEAPNAACIKGDVANFIKFFSDGEAHVHIREIDGVPTRGSGPFCVAPGKHRLGISGHNNGQTAHDYIDLELEAGKKYWLRGNLRGIGVVFQLFDTSSSPEVKISEFSLKVSSVSQPIPIIIPIIRAR